MFTTVWCRVLGRGAGSAGKAGGAGLVIATRGTCAPNAQMARVAHALVHQWEPCSVAVPRRLAASCVTSAPCRSFHTSRAAATGADDEAAGARSARDRVVRDPPSRDQPRPQPQSQPVRGARRGPAKPQQRNKSRGGVRPPGWLTAWGIQPRAKRTPRTFERKLPLNLAGLPLDELKTKLARYRMSHQVAINIGRDIHVRGAQNLGELQVSGGRKKLLARVGCVVWPGRVVEFQESADGTKKWLVDVGAGVVAETVFLPRWGLLCVSSQVGCEQGCSFCHTGTAGRAVNLSVDQIIAQVLTARRELGCYPRSAPGGDVIRSVDFCAQGEPLLNYRNVAGAVNILLDHHMGHMSSRRVRVTTAGVAPSMALVGSDMGVNLTVSLNAGNDKLRSALMPINDKYNLAAVLEACEEYQSTGNRHIVFEYVMMQGVNDSLDQAREVAALIQGPNRILSLLPFNTYPGTTIKSSSTEAMEAFKDVVVASGVTCFVRHSQGADIMAASGQLSAHGSLQRYTSDAWHA